MKGILPPVVFAVLVALAGIQHGMSTDRWHSPRGVPEAVALLDGIPSDLKSWKGTRQTLDQGDLARAGIKGHFYCRYQNARTGAIFNVLIVCGRPGPISVHTPDVCYQGAGYDSFGAPERREIRIGEGETQKFWSLRFLKPTSVNASQLDVLWAWNGGDGWATPDQPRLNFARYSALYKLYVTRDVSPRDKSNVSEQYSEFLTEFLPQLNQALSGYAAP